MNPPGAPANGGTIPARLPSRATVPVLFLILFLASRPAAAQKEVRGPIVHFTPAAADFDTVYCGTTKMLRCAVTNFGDASAPLTVIAPPAAPFSTGLPASAVLRPGDTLAFDAFLTPDRSGTFSNSLDVSADSRRAISLCMLIDASMSMNQMDIADTAGGVVTRLAAAREICRSAAEGLVSILAYGLLDSAAVVRFAGAGEYTVARDFTDDKGLLGAALPDSATGLNTCLYDALIRAAGLMGPRAGRKVILLVTDGQNTCSEPPSVQDAIDAARSAGASVAAVGLGNPDSVALKQIAAATGGFYMPLYSLADAGTPFRAIVAAASAGNHISLPLAGTGVAPRLSASTSFIDFDTLRFGGEACRDLILRNGGTASFFGRLTVLGDPRHSVSTSLTNGTVPGVRPGDSLTVRLCYRPAGALGDTGSILIVSRLPECESNRILIRYGGAGVDPLNLALSSDARGKPGGTVVFPVRLTTRVPAAAGVGTFRFSLRYDRSMLYPLPSYFGGTESALLSGLPSASHATRYEGNDAVTTYIFSGGGIVNDRNDVLLCRPAFLVLMGDALTTNVRAEDAGTDSPFFPAGPASSIRFTADSLCDQGSRLINSSARYATAVSQSSPNPVPASRVATIRFTLAEPSFVRLTIADALGRVVRTLAAEMQSPGEHIRLVETAGLPPGAYFCIFEAGSHREIRKMLVTP